MPALRADGDDRFPPIPTILFGAAAVVGIALGVLATARLWHSPHVESHTWFWIGAAAGVGFELIIATRWARELRSQMWPFAAGLLLFLGGRAFSDRLHQRDSSSSFPNPLSHEHRLALAGAALALAPLAAAAAIRAWKTLRGNGGSADIVDTPLREL